ncbi:hypothetical protein GCM10023231_38510 [Olivibacter ginsenosidimutans]|uniref:CBM6 domain-containing protein n=1 Tax=Olivibacter ginsenosidimutans TaxID=1176537 RepID=A0ABP9C771_9SPHI
MTISRGLKRYALYFLGIIPLFSCTDNYNKGEIYKSPEFTLFPDKVIQGEYEAKALSATEITSNYQSKSTTAVSPRINFKFSINGKDNELPSGAHHTLVVLPDTQEGKEVTIKFGKLYHDETNVPAHVNLPKNAKVHIKLDLREVFDAFDEKGYFTNFNGLKLYKEDFKKVYIAGNISPLSWDFDNLVNHPELELKDADGDHIYELALTLNKEQKQTTKQHWKLTKELGHYPAYSSPYLMMDALYNLSLEEMENNIEADSTFRAGKEWTGVWTRDVSYSTILSMAMLQPEVAKKSLLRKVNKENRIIQDTGTGGAYPVSTDRVVWAIAAWEVYKVTGDEAWLKTSYEIVRNTLEDDQVNAFDPRTGLMHGESTFLDWREQTYPKWMQPVDIYESLALGTNVVHAQAQRVLVAMAERLQDTATAGKYKTLADSLTLNINKHFWLADHGYYGQYIYGGINKILSERSDALGEALAVLFDVADEKQQANIITRTPVVSYGIPCIYPQTTFIPSYHNNAIWPFVQAYWTMAAAKVANDEATVASLASLLRPAALFLTNKENINAGDGDYSRTQVNSSEMLWSLSGNLAMVYKVLFGMSFEPEGLRFKPYVPEVLRGERKLLHFTYRKASLNITLSGYGNTLTTVRVDGMEQDDALIPSNLTGEHEIELVLSDNKLPKGNLNKVPNTFAIDMPALKYENGKLNWRLVDGAKDYKILKNGEANTLVTVNTIPIPQNEFAEYQVVAVDSAGQASFASRPYIVSSPEFVQTYEIEGFVKTYLKKSPGYSGNGYVKIGKGVNEAIQIPITVPTSGEYAISFRYANGNGPINTDNKCAIRSLELNGQFAGPVIFPQRGKDEWSDWGSTNQVIVHLDKGEQQLSLQFKQPVNQNMDGALNEALIDYLNVIKIK